MQTIVVPPESEHTAREIMATTASIFERQESIPLELPAAVALVGCGGVGSWIGYFLALAGVNDLHLFDGDIVSNSNLNRSPYGPDMLGKPKTEALATLIRRVRPNCKVEGYPSFSTEFANTIGLFDDKVDESVWLCASTDTWKSRIDANEWCRKTGVAYIEAAAEGEVGSIAHSPGEWATEDENKPGYAHVPVWVGPAVVAAWMATSYILHSIGAYATIRLGWDNHNQRINMSYGKELK